MQDVNPRHSCSTGKCVAELGMLHLRNTSKSGKNRVPRKHQGLISGFFSPTFLPKAHILQGSGHPWSSRRGSGMTIPSLHHVLQPELSCWDSSQQVLSPISNNYHGSQCLPCPLGLGLTPGG